MLLESPALDQPVELFLLLLELKVATMRHLAMLVGGLRRVRPQHIGREWEGTADSIPNSALIFKHVLILINLFITPYPSSLSLH